MNNHLGNYNKSSYDSSRKKIFQEIVRSNEPAKNRKKKIISFSLTEILKVLFILNIWGKYIHY